MVVVAVGVVGIWQKDRREGKLLKKRGGGLTMWGTVGMEGEFAPITQGPTLAYTSPWGKRQSNTQCIKFLMWGIILLSLCPNFIMYRYLIWFCVMNLLICLN